MLRYRGSNKNSIETVKILDAFPKIPDSYVETSTGGATLTVFTCILIGFLILSEVWYYVDTRFMYEYQVDVEYDTKVWLNFDITIATPCSFVGADVVDLTDQVLIHNAKVIEEPAIFNKKAYQKTPTHHVINYEEDGIKINEMALKQPYLNLKKDFIPHHVKFDDIEPDGCRFYGNIPLTKVAGNFHIVSGKAVSLFGSHAHLSFLFGQPLLNFSHRIDHFSFGDMRSGLVNPLNGMEKISLDSNRIFQYYLDVVSTKIRMRWVHSNTYQFSMTELNRDIDHSTGSHGMPGIFFKYDFSPVCITIQEHAIPFGRFIMRLCAIIGGVFATSCIINGLFNIFYSGYLHLFTSKQSKLTEVNKS